jgi:transposase
MRIAEGCARVTGFSPLVSTAIVADTGNGAAFRRGREFAAWVGMVPGRYFRRGKQNRHQQARQDLSPSHTGAVGQWVHRLAQRAPGNRVVVTIAIAWMLSLEPERRRTDGPTPRRETRETT